MDFQITKIASTTFLFFVTAVDGNIRLLFSLFDFKSGEITVVMAANSFGLSGFCVVVDSCILRHRGEFMRLMVVFIFVQP